MPRTRQVKNKKAKPVRSVRIFGRPAISDAKRAAAGLRAPIAQARKLHERNGGHGGVFDISADINELKQREASFRLLFDANPVPMIVCGLDGEHILAVNDAAVEHYHG